MDLCSSHDKVKVVIISDARAAAMPESVSPQPAVLCFLGDLRVPRISANIPTPGQRQFNGHSCCLLVGQHSVVFDEHSP